MEETAGLSTTTALWLALLASLVLAGLHLLAPRIRKLPGVPERATTSFAGGLAAAYVFLHLLPEVADGEEAIGEALGNVLEPTALLELAIFAVALTGFTVFYGLERVAQRRADRSGGEGGAGLFWLHLGAFGVYNALITYTMPLRLETGVGFGVLFTVAMGLHFVLTDRGMEEHYRERFERTGRWVLAAALLAGWVLVAIAAPTSTVVVALLTALLGGAVLLNVFKEELPSADRSSFGWFVAGLVLYAGLLFALTAIE